MAEFDTDPKRFEHKRWFSIAVTLLFDEFDEFDDGSSVNFGKFFSL